MELEHVLGNTWVFKSWELIPFYKVDESHCILLDTGLNDQREDLEESLQREGLTPVGVICSHAHIDHMGNVAYLKEKYGTQLAMSLGEAGHQMSYLGLNITNPMSAARYAELGLEGMLLHPETAVNAMQAVAPMRDGKPLPTAALCYGHIPLMLTRACPLRNVHS